MAQECSCCSESKTSSQFKKFPTCETKPCNTVCNSCWTQYLKTDFMENPTKQLTCFVCNVPMDKTKVLKLLIQSPDDRKHYEHRLKRVVAMQNGERQCIFANCKNAKVEVDGRLSSCGWCFRQACIACDAPEHSGESCEEYQARAASTHSKAEESATATALAQGYSAKEEVGKLGRLRQRPKRPLPCPSCGIWIERFGGCLRLRCPVCSLDFCGECAAPYLGKNSVPLLGNQAHHETCHYFTRKVEDRRFRPAVSMQAEPGSSSMHGNSIPLSTAAVDSDRAEEQHFLEPSTGLGQ